MKINTQTPSAAAAADPLVAKATQAAEKFEAFFVKKMLNQMRENSRTLSGEDGLFRDKTGQEMQDLADGLVADALAGRHAFGIADLMLKQILPGLSAGAAASPSTQDQPASERP